MAPIYILLPAVAAVAWALYTKYQQNRITDFIVLALASFVTLLNALMVSRIMAGDITVAENMVQMGAASCIVPLAYTYFARQVGRQSVNDAAVSMLWMVVPLTFVPEIIISNPFEPIALPEEGVQPFCITVMSGGKTLISTNIGNLVMLIQCIITIGRIVPLMMMLRKHHLHLNKKVYSFLTCWTFAIVFIIMVSSLTRAELSSTFGQWFYYTFYSLLLIFLSTLVALRYDLYPVETEEGEAVEDLSLYVQQKYGNMSAQLRLIMEQQKQYLDTQLTAEQVIERLNTNHTYFSQMMQSEWGMSFSEYLNNLRLANVERLLRDNSLSISDAATQSGFADAGYMSRRFKAKYGVTPSEWRKSL